MSEVNTNSEEFKQAVADAVAEATEGLRNKNTELLGKLKKAQKDSAIDPADLEAVERERDDLKAKLADANKALKRATTDLDAATKARDETVNAFHGTLRDAQLTDALTKAGVVPGLIDAAKALHSGAVTVVDENGQRVVKAGDKSVGDFIKEWAASDAGKHFVAAPDAHGGGSHGGRGAPGGPGKRSAMNHAEKAEYIAKHGVDNYNSLPE